MLDHIIEHLDLADSYAANAARISSLKNRSKHLRDLSRRCIDAADRERAEAVAHARHFSIPDLVVAQELATWRRLTRYSVESVEAFTVADLRWLRAVVRHGRGGSRNFRRAAELLHLVPRLLPVDAGVLTGDDPDAQAFQRNFADLVRCSPDCP